MHPHALLGSQLCFKSRVCLEECTELHVSMPHFQNRRRRGGRGVAGGETEEVNGQDRETRERNVIRAASPSETLGAPLSPVHPSCVASTHEGVAERPSL